MLYKILKFQLSLICIVEEDNRTGVKRKHCSNCDDSPDKNQQPKGSYLCSHKLVLNSLIAAGI